MKLTINTDGLSKNNPGQAAIGAVLRNARKEKVATISQAIGIATNNVAEYRAVIAALEKALGLGAKQVEVLSDSELMVEQLNGRYKVKSEGLRPLHVEATRLMGRFEKVTVKYIPRERNTEADALANAAIKRK